MLHDCAASTNRLQVCGAHCPCMPRGGRGGGRGGRGMQRFLEPALDEDYASMCMARERDFIRAYPFQIEQFPELCWRRGWQGWCKRCKKVILDKAHGAGAGAPCVNSKHPLIHPQPMPLKTKALLDRAERAAAGFGWAPPIPERWRNKTVRVRSFVQDGFWVRAHFVLTQGLWASLRGMPFFVQLHRNAACVDHGLTCSLETAQPFDHCMQMGTCDPYSSNGSGAGWEEYFEPIGAVPASEVIARTPESQIVELSCSAAWFVNRGVLGGNPDSEIYAQDFATASAYRARNAALVAKWVKVRPDILWKADAEWSRIIGREQRTAVIGVHLRGTDKYQTPKVHPEKYFGLIDAFLDTQGGRLTRAHLDEYGLPRPGSLGGVRTESTYDGRETGWYSPHRKALIFLATDDAEYQQAILQRYGRDRVAQLNDGKVLRANGTDAIWKQKDGGGAHTKGLEVLLDTLLLSRCDYLIKTASSVSEFAIYFNPALANRSYDFSLKGQQLPSWHWLSERFGVARSESLRTSLHAVH
eukprot:4562889-Prymnesium_polylepis.1